MDEHIRIFDGTTITVTEGNQVDANLNDLSWWTEKHNGYATREMVDMLMMEYGMDANGGKDLGVAATLERLGVDVSEAIAFGDGENDLSMFGAVGTSVAMGNAQDTVKAAATYVTTAVDDDGIYNAAKHFGLV